MDITPAFFSSPFAWNIFFHLLTFRLCVSLALKWVSCRQHIEESYFLIQSATYVFGLEHLVHWHLEWLLIGMYLLTFCCLFSGCLLKHNWFTMFQVYSKVIQFYIHIYIHIHIYILFQILFHYSLLQDIEYNSLCYKVEPCCLPILYIVVCIC